MRVWKIGSNWGNRGKSVLPLFLDYGVAFFGGANDGSKKGDYRLVAKDDLLVITEGSRLVAIGKVQTPFMSWDELSAGFRKTDQDEYREDDVVGCRAAIELLHGNESPQWSIDPQKRFCAASIPPEQVQECHDQLKEDLTFDILARTITLYGEDERKSLFCPSTSYRVPIYQRPYSWGEAELTRLLQDVVRGVQNEEPVFLGTMQLTKPIFLDLKKTKRRYDIIDGQQRISSLFILMRILSLMDISPPSPCPDGSILRTLVDRGSAQRDWDEFLYADLAMIRMAGAHRNPYLRNAAFLHGKLTELFAPVEKEDVPEGISGQSLSAFLADQIRIVVIETHAGLSKTIQIFNTINTTGLDLSGADVFKVRFFEYLKDKRGCQDSAFDDISALYGRIQEENRKRTRSSVSMTQILAILQTLLIAYYDLPVVLYDYATDRFFDQLFDSILGLNPWAHFSPERLKDIVADRSPLAPLSVDGIERLIKARYRYDDLFGTEDKNPVSDVMLQRLMWHSRYGGRYWYLPVIHLYLHEGADEGARKFFGELVRLVLCYSLKQRKAISAAHTCIRGALRKMIASSAEATQHLAAERIRLADDVRNVLLKEELAWNPTWKSIACRLGELLANGNELERSNPKLLERVFDMPVDIEHIQSFNDKEGQRREDIWRDWDYWLNGLGNLAMLESSINRSISNGLFTEKKGKYATSQFTTIRDLANFDHWALENCKARCIQETQKLMAWLFP